MSIDARIVQSAPRVLRHRDELPDIGGLLSDLGGQHDLVVLIDHGLRVERVIEPAAGLHDPRLGIGEIALRFRFGHRLGSGRTDRRVNRSRVSRGRGGIVRGSTGILDVLARRPCLLPRSFLGLLPRRLLGFVSDSGFGFVRRVGFQRIPRGPQLHQPTLAAGQLRGDFIPAPVRRQDFMNTYTNNGQRSVLVNLKTPEGMDLFWSLMSDADVLIENFTRGVADRLERVLQVRRVAGYTWSGCVNQLWW